jgi:hypothetical protein
MDKGMEAGGVPIAHAVAEGVTLGAVLQGNSVAMLLQDMHYQRVAALEEEIEDIRRQTEAEDQTYSLAKEAVVKALDEAYAAEVERDEVFKSGSGERFEATYVRNRFGSVRDWAASKKRLTELRVRREQQVGQRRQLEEDQEHIHKTPAELYRAILSLQDELRHTKEALQQTREQQQQQLQETREELQQMRREQQQQHQQLRDELQQRGAELQQTREHMAALIHRYTQQQQQQQRQRELEEYLNGGLVDGCMRVNGGTVTNAKGMLGAKGMLVGKGTPNGGAALTGGRPFPEDRPTVFVVQILECHGAVFCGIACDGRFYSSARSSYGWECQNQVSEESQMRAQPRLDTVSHAMVPWESGDVAVIKYSPLEHSLNMFHRRLDQLFAIDLPSGLKFRIHIKLKANESVSVRATTEEDEII